MRRLGTAAAVASTAGPLLLLGAAFAHAHVPPAWHRAWVIAVILTGVVGILGGIAGNGVARGSGWWRFGWGIAWYGASDIAWLLLTAVVGADHPAGTVVWLLGLPGLLVTVSGLRRVLAVGRHDVDREARLDAFIIALAVAYVAWHATVVPLVARDGWLSYGVIGSTPYLLMAVAAMALVLGRSLQHGAQGTCLGLLAAAIPAAALSSTVYWTVEADVAWQSAPVSRVLMALAYALAVAAVRHPSMRGLASSSEPGPQRTRLVLVGLGAAVVPAWHAAEALAPIPPADPVSALLGLAITGLAIGRIAVTLAARASVEQALRDREARFRSLVAHAFDYVALVDVDMRLTWGSDNIGGVTGRGLTEVLGRPLLDEVHPADRDRVAVVFDDCLAAAGRRSHGTARLETTGGGARWIEYTFANELDDPAVGGVVVNYRDVTDTRLARHELERQATHDPLTGLPNRAAVMARLRRAAVAGVGRTALLFLDLDRFKLVNDSLGHPAGDRLLVQVADRLIAAVGVAGTVARIGGDEFVVLVEGVAGTGEVLQLAGVLCEALALPAWVDDHEVSTSASIGIALHEPGQSPEELLQDADTAMYRVKEQGRDGYAVFDPRWRGSSAARLHLETALRRALQDGGGLRLHHQPIVSLATGRMSGVEALLRWDRGVLVAEDGGEIEIDPGELVRVAEESGLIGPLGDWVVRQAVRDLAQIDRWAPGLDLTMSVNVSGAQLRRGDFAATVAAALGDHGIAAERLVVELTESVVVEGVPAAHTTLAALRAAGVVLAMDDFGTGYSALATLKRIPFSEVKIDRSFVDGLGEDTEATAIVNAVVGMAHALGLTVVAEGVETAEQLRVLADLGCDHAQGWLLGRPVPIDSLRPLLRGAEDPSDGRDALAASG
jgi:diguanylate cyclase (GGDEF)-like protein/PAS domain S-box-containing protein